MKSVYVTHGPPSASSKHLVTSPRGQRAASRESTAQYNQRAKLARARGVHEQLQKAALRFLPLGSTLDEPRTLDLVKWPRVGPDAEISNVSDALRALILSEDQLCLWCQQEPATTIDHVRPLSRGGTNHPLNLIGACKSCNNIKADYLPSELGWKLRLPQRAFQLLLEMRSR